MDDSLATIDDNMCMVVEIQENELGEIVFVERPREEYLTEENKFCVVDCELEHSDTESSASPTLEETRPENIEIVYLPNYEEPCGSPILLKQEMGLLLEGDIDGYCKSEGDNYNALELTESLPTLGIVTNCKPNLKRPYPASSALTKKPSNMSVNKNASIWKDTRLRSKTNIVLKHQDVFHGQNKPWLKLNSKDFVDTKNISSVTTIYTKPTGMSDSADGTENRTIPEIEVGVQTSATSLPHKCTHCDRSFRQSVSLQIHSTLHSQSIPDSCLVS